MIKTTKDKTACFWKCSSEIRYYNNMIANSQAIRGAS